MKTDKTASRSSVGIVLAPALLLLVPSVAMQFTEALVWTRFDFAAAGGLLVGTALLYVLATRKAGSVAHRAAVGVAVVTALLLVWLNLAVGIIGTEDNPANLMYVGVLVVGIIGALIARLQPHGMARALLAMAVAQALVAVIALVAGEQRDSIRSLLQLLGLTGMFVALFVGSAWLFRRAAQERTSAGTGPES